MPLFDILIGLNDSYEIRTHSFDETLARVVWFIEILYDFETFGKIPDSKQGGITSESDIKLLDQQTEERKYLLWRK